MAAPDRVRQPSVGSLAVGPRTARLWPACVARTQWLAVYALGLILFVANLIAAHSLRSYNSDDVALQTILGQWLRGYHDVAHLGSDSFILKVPLYLLIRALLDNGRPAILVTTLLLNVTGFVLFLASVRYFVSKFAVARPHLFLWPLLWVAGLGMALSGALITPNLRNLEIGLAFLLMMLVAKYCDGELNVSKMWLVVAVPLLGLFLYDDPYFLYLGVVPLILLLGAKLALGSRAFDARARRALAFLVAGAVAYKVFDLAFRSFGLEPAAADTSLANFEEIRHHFRLLVHGGLRLFEADFIDNPISISRPRILLNLVVLACTLLFPVALFRGRVFFRDEPWKWFFGLYALLVAAVFVFSNQAIDLDSARYLVLLPFLFVVLLGVGFQTIGRRVVRWTAVGVVALATIVNLTSSYDAYRHRPPSIDAARHALIRAAQDNGLTKGYAEYWSSNINTYLSKDRVDFIQVRCMRFQVKPYDWLTDDGIRAKPAQRTFYVWEGDTRPACFYEELVRQFGAPARVVAISDTTKLLVYDFDLFGRMRGRA